MTEFDRLFKPDSPESHEDKIVGWLPGIVLSLDDPEKLGRVLVSSPLIGADTPLPNDNSAWLHVATTSTNDNAPGGMHYPIEPGTQAILLPMLGNPKQLIVIGFLHSRIDRPSPEFDRNSGVWGMQTSGGVVELHDDRRGASVKAYPNGVVTKVTASGDSIAKTANGATSHLKADGSVFLENEHGSQTISSTGVMHLANKSGEISFDGKGKIRIDGTDTPGLTLDKLGAKVAGRKSKVALLKDDLRPASAIGNIPRLCDRLQGIAEDLRSGNEDPVVLLWDLDEAVYNLVKSIKTVAGVKQPIKILAALEDEELSRDTIAGIDRLKNYDLSKIISSLKKTTQVDRKKLEEVVSQISPEETQELPFGIEDLLNTEDTSSPSFVERVLDLIFIDNDENKTKARNILYKHIDVDTDKLKGAILENWSDTDKEIEAWDEDGSKWSRGFVTRQGERRVLDEQARPNRSQPPLLIDTEAEFNEILQGLQGQPDKQLEAALGSLVPGGYSAISSAIGFGYHRQIEFLDRLERNLDDLKSEEGAGLDEVLNLLGIDSNESATILKILEIVEVVANLFFPETVAGINQFLGSLKEAIEKISIEIDNVKEAINSHQELQEKLGKIEEQAANLEADIANILRGHLEKVDASIDDVVSVKESAELLLEMTDSILSLEAIDTLEELQYLKAVVDRLSKHFDLKKFDLEVFNKDYVILDELGKNIDVLVEQLSKEALPDAIDALIKKFDNHALLESNQAFVDLDRKLSSSSTGGGVDASGDLMEIASDSGKMGGNIRLGKDAIALMGPGADRGVGASVISNKKVAALKGPGSDLGLGSKICADTDKACLQAPGAEKGLGSEVEVTREKIILNAPGAKGSLGSSVTITQDEFIATSPGGDRGAGTSLKMGIDKATLSAAGGKDDLGAKLAIGTEKAELKAPASSTGVTPNLSLESDRFLLYGPEKDGAVVSGDIKTLMLAFEQYGSSLRFDSGAISLRMENSSIRVKPGSINLRVGRTLLKISGTGVSINGRRLRFGGKSW